MAGLVGQDIPRYQLFGKTLTVASALSASSQPKKILISNATKKLIQKNKAYKQVWHGIIDIPGVKTVETFWLEKVKETANLLSIMTTEQDRRTPTFR